jgi:hypothetical protein
LDGPGAAQVRVSQNPASRIQDGGAERLTTCVTPFWLGDLQRHSRRVIEAYHRADKAIQQIVDLLAAA